MIQILRNVVFVSFLTALSPLAMAQAVEGNVVDENGQPLPGANVIVRGQSGVGTSTDFDGNYVLNDLRPGKLSLVFSFIGYAKQERTVTLEEGQTVRVNVTLAPDQNQLDEVVVVGYGVQRKRDVTGSMVSLDSKELNDMPTPSFETAIQGKAPGVQVITGSGLAGSGSLVRIRGAASISAAGDPLYVIDGIPITQDYFLKGNTGAMNNNPLATINPNDIEDVQILKDAAATAIYGSRGANGVILITTKRGKEGKLKFNFQSSIGIAEPTRRPEMLNTDQYLQLYREAWINDGNTGTPTLPGAWTWEDAQRYNTNWVDETIGTGFIQNYDFSMQKGTDKYNFYAGLSYDENESYLIGNSYERLSARFNADYRPFDNLGISISTSLAQADNNRIDAAWSGGLGSAMSTALPYYPIYWDEALLASRGDTVHQPGDFFTENGIGNNPVAQRELQTWRQREYRSINTLKINYSPVKNLTLVYSGSFDYLSQKEDRFFENYWLRDVEDRTDSNLTGGRAERYPLVAKTFNSFFTATYDYAINEDNNLKFLVGSEIQEFENFTRNRVNENGDINNTFDNVGGPVFDQSELRNNAEFDSIIVGDKRRFVSFFGRLNYDYKGKYLVQAVLRADGSSRFGPDNRYGFFPSIGTGWIISEEDFLKDNRTVNFLKLKASYGLTGNAAIPADQFRSTYQLDNQSYNGQPIRFPVRLPNPDLRWEQSEVLDVSLEAGFLQDRITAELAYYYKYSDGVFISVTLPRSFGFGGTNFTDNVAEIRNTGVEFQMTTRNLVGEFQWTTNFNIARNFNEVTNLGNFSPEAVSGGTNDTRVIVGEPVGTNFLVRYAGENPETGRPQYLDLDGNVVDDWDPNNRVATGSVIPDAVGGVNNTFRYKKIDLSVLVVFKIGGNIYDSSGKRQNSPLVDEWNKTPQVFDRWRQPGDDAEFARLTLDVENLGSQTPWINTDQFLFDASYARIRNIVLGYNLPVKWVRKLKMQSARVSFTGTNLFTFTKFPGLDPEIARDFEDATDRNMSSNITFLTPPQQKSYVFGLNVSF